MEVVQELDQRVQSFREVANQYKKKVIQLSWARLIAFLVGISLFIHGLSTQLTFAHIGGSTLAIIAFVMLIVLHRKTSFKYSLNAEMANFNQDELKRAELNLNNFQDGEDFLDEHHPYAYDLDLFGRHSIFQLINRCVLHHSQEVLAKWMLKRSKPQEVMSRQSAVKELTAMINFRHSMVAVAKVVFGKKKKEKLEEKLDDLYAWMEKDIEVKNPVIIYGAALLMLISNHTFLTLTIINSANYIYLLGSVFISILVLGAIFSLAKELGEKLDASSHIIEAYAKILELIEKQRFSDPNLQKLQSNLTIGRVRSSESINQLKKIVFRFGSRASSFYILFDGFFLIDFYLVYAALKWKKKHAHLVHQWMNTVHEFEALNSIAGFAHLESNYVYPTFVEEKYLLEIKQVGHPLIPKNQCVRNDFSSTEKGNVIVITGSNMSGKSTFERTLGVNIVLAQMGAPVFASEMKLSPMEVFTSMRTKDNLEESTSSFYAELKRIKQLLQHVSEHESTFYVLDEILKGTNSDDRHKGAVALANQLSAERAFGLISTHDLALSELEKENKNIVNYSFNSVIEEDDIIFDYKLTEGPCKSFNASKLMQKMGIAVD